MNKIFFGLFLILLSINISAKEQDTSNFYCAWDGLPSITIDLEVEKSPKNFSERNSINKSEAVPLMDDDKIVNPSKIPFIEYVPCEIATIIYKNNKSKV